MKITILPKAKTEKVENFDMQQPNVLSWLEATEEGNRKLSIPADTKSFGMDNDTLNILIKLVEKHGLFDGKPADEAFVRNLELGFFITLYGKLLEADGFLQGLSEDEETEKAQQATEV